MTHRTLATAALVLGLFLSTTPSPAGKPVSPVPADQRFDTPEDAIFAYLHAVKNSDLPSALHCFDFPFRYRRTEFAISFSVDHINSEITTRPGIFDEGAKTSRQYFAAFLEKNLLLLRQATSSIVSSWGNHPFDKVFVIRYTLPDGRWVQNQICVARTALGWRLWNANIPDFQNSHPASKARS